MQDASWYFVGRDDQRQGPVSAAEISAAYRGGTITRNGLVWRQGMAEWLPLEQLENELGIGPEDHAAVPPPVPAAAPPIVTTRRSNGIDRQDVVYAGFLRRWAAFILDRLILVVPFYALVILVVVVFAPRERGGSDPASGAILLLIWLFYFVCAALYYAGLESSKHQATLGKRALGIKVTDASGGRLNFSQALGRWFAASLSYLTCYVGFLMAAFTDRKRALHDMVVDTLVVDRWAYTEFPERQQREASGCLIAFLIGFFVAIPMIAILAAIAISQYQDYVIRSQVSEGAVLANGMKTAVAEYYQNRGRLPESNAQAGLASADSITGIYVGSVDAAGGSIVATYSSAFPHKANRMLDGKTLVFTPKVFVDRIEWQCGSPDLKQKWCSAACTCQ